MTCEERKDLLLLYVSDALESAEKQELRRHLATGCPECLGALAEAEATFNAIPLGLNPVKPSADLKIRLMQQIDAAAAEKSMSIAPSRIDRTESVTRADLAPDSLPIRLFRLLVPAAVAAGVAIVATHAFMNQQLQKVTLQARDAQHDASASQMLLASVQEQFRSHAQVVELLQSPDVKIVHLKATEEQPAAVANVVWDQQDRRWLFLATGFKPVAAGQTYELWIIPKGGSPLPAGTFDVDPKGRALVSVDLPKGGVDSNTAAVTNEQSGGVPAPKGKIQVVGSVE